MKKNPDPFEKAFTELFAAPTFSVWKAKAYYILCMKGKSLSRFKLGKNIDQNCRTQGAGCPNFLCNYILEGWWADIFKIWQCRNDVVECCILLVYTAGENENTIFPGLID